MPAPKPQQRFLKQRGRCGFPANGKHAHDAGSKRRRGLPRHALDQNAGKIDGADEQASTIPLPFDPSLAKKQLNLFSQRIGHTPARRFTKTIPSLEWHQASLVERVVSLLDDRDIGLSLEPRNWRERPWMAQRCRLPKLRNHDTVGVYGAPRHPVGRQSVNSRRVCI